MKWSYCHQFVWSGGVLQERWWIQPGEGRWARGRAVVMEPWRALHWGLMLVYVPKSGWGRKKEGRKDGGLTQLSLVRPPTGLIILDCLFPTFCCHGDSPPSHFAVPYSTVWIKSLTLYYILFYSVKEKRCLLCIQRCRWLWALLSLPLGMRFLPTETSVRVGKSGTVKGTWTCFRDDNPGQVIFWSCFPPVLLYTCHVKI